MGKGNIAFRVTLPFSPFPLTLFPFPICLSRVGFAFEIVPPLDEGSKTIAKEIYTFMLSRRCAIGIVVLLFALSAIALADQPYMRAARTDPPSQP